MSQTRTATYLLAAAITLSLGAGCDMVEDWDEDGIETVQQAGWRICPGCGYNGLRQGDWNYTFSQLKKGALSGAGLWGGPGPKSFCNPSKMYGSWCEMRGKWQTWLDTGSNYLRNIKVRLMENMIKLATHDDYRVVDPGGYDYYGDYDLVPQSLGSNWSWVTMERMSAGLVLLLNEVQGVPLCLATRDNNGRCVGSGAVYTETIAYGQVFYGHHIGLHGTPNAQRPFLNNRVDGVASTSVEEVWNWNQAKCSTTGSGVRWRATNCNGWPQPVTALVAFPPNTWYYNGMKPKPPGVPIEY